MSLSLEEVTFPLSPDERATLYHLLGKNGAFCGGERRSDLFNNWALPDLLVAASEESRYDPRLMGILIHFFTQNYRKLNPFELHERLKEIPTPQTMGVIGEFAQRVDCNTDLCHFFELVLSKVEKAPYQAYYISQTRPRPLKMYETIKYTPSEFKNWGFWSQMDPFLKEFKPKKKLLDLSPKRSSKHYS